MPHRRDLYHLLQDASFILAFVGGGVFVLAAIAAIAAAPCVAGLAICAFFHTGWLVEAVGLALCVPWVMFVVWPVLKRFAASPA